jgi:hypothetical protein
MFLKPGAKNANGIHLIGREGVYRSLVALYGPLSLHCQVQNVGHPRICCSIESDLPRSDLSPIYDAVIFPGLLPDAVRSALASDAMGGVTCPH